MGAPGFDDAPIVSIEDSGYAKQLTLVLPYYENPCFLQTQLDSWWAWSETCRRKIRFILVDDGSPEFPASEVLQRQAKLPLATRLFRVQVDVRWNWLAARNIGMHYAETDWCVLTDMDHMISPAVAEALVWGAHDPAVIYRFSRKEHTGEKIHPHPNSMFMPRVLFWKAGGYDEALSGFYGSDGDWRRRCAKTAPIKTLKQELIRCEHVGDSSTIRYKRKQPEDAGKKPIVRARRPGWKPKVLSFPYSEIILNA